MESFILGKPNLSVVKIDKSSLPADQYVGLQHTVLSKFLKILLF